MKKSTPSRTAPGRRKPDPTRSSPIASETAAPSPVASLPLADTSLAAPLSALPERVWDREVCLRLIDQLWALRATMLAREAALSSTLARVSPGHRDSARNLIHYLCLRDGDLRPLQEKLSWLGLSSLGRSESHVLANLDKVLGILHRLTGQGWAEHSGDEPTGRQSSRQRLANHADRLLGPAPTGRTVRIMVTLPSEAATDYGVVRALVKAGMDIARINCAHDGPEQWKAMASHVRRAAKSAQRKPRILMDLGGPKIRTGDIAPGPAVLKVRPEKDLLGRTLRPARVGLVARNDAPHAPGLDARLTVDADWLSGLRRGQTLTFKDARGKRREWRVSQCDGDTAVAECPRTTYLTLDTVLQAGEGRGHGKSTSRVGGIATRPGVLHLKVGDALLLTRDGLGGPASDDGATCAHVACTLPEVLDQARVGERVWLDDGRMGGVIREVGPDGLRIEITQAKDGGDKLMADKGINLPDSALTLPALTDKDMEDLRTVATQADMVGLSFVQTGADVALLRAQMQALQRDDLGIVLKIETLKGFEHLPELMLEAMAGPSAGVMIARGDLAVECGYERLAEIQEEILWCAESAHLPVIWATQVLETLAKTGRPSRAEVTDAGMGVRAECVMLNKGPFIADAIHTLDDILRRMSGHVDKKKPMLRALRAWDSALPR